MNNIDLEKVPWLYYDPNYERYINPVRVNPSIQIQRIKAKDPQKICYYSDAMVKVQSLKSHKSFSIYSNTAIENSDKTLYFPNNPLIAHDYRYYQYPLVDRNKSTEYESSDTENSIDANNDMNNFLYFGQLK